MEEDFKLFTSLRYDPALVRVPGEESLTITYAGWNQQKASAFYMLDLHRDRLLRAATHWGWTGAINAITGDEGLKRLQVFLGDAVRDIGDTPHRIKVELSQDGTLRHVKSPTPNVPLYNLFPPFLPSPGEDVSTQPGPERKGPSKTPEYEVLVDTQPTTKSEFTHYKTTRRDMYDGARARGRLALADLKEVLLVNDDSGLIMEGSLTTCYFWRDGKWVTPVVPPRYGAGAGQGGASGGNDGTTRRWALEKYERPPSSALVYSPAP